MAIRSELRPDLKGIKTALRSVQSATSASELRPDLKGIKTAPPERGLVVSVGPN